MSSIAQQQQEDKGCFCRHQPKRQGRGLSIWLSGEHSHALLGEYEWGLARASAGRMGITHIFKVGGRTTDAGGLAYKST